MQIKTNEGMFGDFNSLRTYMIINGLYEVEIEYVNYWGISMDFVKGAYSLTQIDFIINAD